MNDCRKIERLIHLHREGERTPDEDRKVRDHVARCAACSGLLRSVERAGAEISHARNTWESAFAGPGLVNRTLGEIRGAGAFRSRISPLGRAGLRPAIAFALFCAVVLAAQQGRDAWESAKMERRLAALAGSGGTAQVTVADGVSALAAALMPRSNGGRGAGVVRASAVPGFLIPGFGGGDLFRMYADKYPSLASVDPYDGIDDREREVLATEGKAFLDEFRTLVRKGE
jgi:hypothetical protein